MPRTRTSASGDGAADLRAALAAAWARPSSQDEVRKTLFVPAPNAIEWEIGAQWGNSPSLYTQPRQWEVIRDFFELRCPDCNRGRDASLWGKPRSYFEDEVLLRWHRTYGEDACPKCGTTRSEFWDRGAFVSYERIHAVIGQRAGKSTLFAAIARFVEHMIVCIAHSTQGGLHRHLGSPPSDTFGAAFLAAERVQARETIWAKYVNLRQVSPWFAQYLTWVKHEEDIQPRPPGRKPWEYKETDAVIENGHPELRLTLNSATTNAPALRGPTRLYGLLDEISHMLQTDSTRSATELYRVMRNSVKTARSRVTLYGAWPWIGFIGSCTSPAFRGDKGMALLDEAADDPRLFTVHEATWNFNPLETRKSFDMLLKTDPVGTRRDFGAEPPGAAYPLIHDERRFWELAVDPTAAPSVEFSTRRFVDETGHAYVAVVVAAVRPPKLVEPKRYIAFDAGANFDAFTGACGYGIPVLDDDERIVDVEVYYDWVMRVLALETEEIFFDGTYDVIDESNRILPVTQAEFDHWQSKQLVQGVRTRYGIYAEEAGTADADYEAFRTASLSGRVHLLPPLPGEFDPETHKRLVDPPDLSPQGAVVYELLELEQDPKTRRVYNPKKGKLRGWHSDDAARVVTHVHRMVVRAGYVERMDDRSVRARRARQLGYENRTGGGAVVHAPQATRRLAPGMLPGVAQVARVGHGRSVGPQGLTLGAFRPKGMR